MIKYLPLLLLLISCNPEPKDELYHSIDTNLYCKSVKPFNGQVHGQDCFSMASGKKFTEVYNLTNVVKIK